MEATKTTRFAHHINDHAHPSSVAMLFKVETSTASVGVLTLRNICTRAWHLFDAWTCIRWCVYRGKNRHFGFGASFAIVGRSWSCNITFWRMICFHTLVFYNDSNFWSTGHLEWQCRQPYVEAKNSSSLVRVFNSKLRMFLNLFYIFMSECLGDTHPRRCLKYNAWRLAWRGKLMWTRWIDSKDPLLKQLKHEGARERSELFELNGVTQKMLHEFTWFGVWSKLVGECTFFVCSKECVS